MAPDATDFPRVAPRGIALALGGGAARTIAHIGVLQVLAREQIPIACLAGTSGGALVASLFAAGYPLVDLERDALGIEWRRLALLRPHPLGILSTEKLSEFVERRIGTISFEELRIPCAVVATDLTAGEKRVFDRGPVAAAVGASCAVPEFYRPVDLDGHTFVDGGVVEPLPVATVRSMCAARDCPVVAVSVLRWRPRPEGPRHIWHLLGQITEVVQREMVRRDAPLADLLVKPDVAGYPYFHLENAAGLIGEGAEAMQRGMAPLRALLEGRPEARPEPGHA